MSRTANEDFFGYWEPDDDRTFDLKGRLVVVCDGMGGHSGGEIASRMAVKKLIAAYESATSDDIVENLRTAIETANAAVFGEGKVHPELAGMGTTCTAMVQRRDIVYFGQVGDSRAYRIRGGAMKQMTKDHSLVQQLVDEGLLDESEMESHPDKNVILRSLGVKAEVDVDVSHVPVVDEDMLLLCSDGLSGLIADAEMLKIVNDGMSNGGGLRKICESLIDAANAAGGHDNITVQILRVKQTASATTDTTPPETVTQSFNADEVSASIAQARAEAEAKGLTPTPKTAETSTSTEPAMPVPTVEKPPAAPFPPAVMIGGGLLVGLFLGLAGGLAFGGGGTPGDPGLSGQVLEGAKMQAIQAGAKGSAAFEAAVKREQEAAGEAKASLAAAQAYLSAASEAQRNAATSARDHVQAKSTQLVEKDSPLVAKALNELNAGTAAFKEQHYAKARAHFAAAEPLFAAVEEGQ